MSAEKPALPKPRVTYRVSQDRKEYEDTLAKASGAFLVWATVQGAPPTAGAVLLRRVKTHEIPGSKWVEYRAEPDGFLANGTPFSNAPSVIDSVIASDWSTYLTLVRRKKGAGKSERDGHLAFLEQATAKKVGTKFKDDQAWTLRAAGTSDW